MSHPGTNRASWIFWPALTLLILALIRWSVRDHWDGWSTALVSLSAVAAAALLVVERTFVGQQARLRQTRYSLQLGISAVLMVAVMAMVNYLADRHNRSFDLTDTGIFTLAPETQKVLHALPGEVTALAFYPSGRESQAAGLLQRYAELSPRFHYEVVDPDDDPRAAKAHGVTEYGTVIVETGEPDLTTARRGEIRIEPDTTQGSRLTLSEEKLTNALVKVVRGGARAVYILQGHGEADVDNPRVDGYSRAAAILKDQAFDVKPLFLTRQSAVPADCSVLIIAGPARDPYPVEIDAIQKYLEGGGKVLVLVDPPPGASLQGFLKSWGVSALPDVIIDPSTAGRLAGNGPAIPAVTDYDGQAPITQNFHVATLWPVSRPIETDQEPGDAQIMPLAQTGPDSFAQPAVDAGKSLTFNPNRDRKGPLLIAASITRQSNTGKQARLVVLGSSNLLINGYIDQAGNSDFFLACMNWLEEQESLIALQPKPPQDRRVDLTDEQVRLVFWVIVVGLPASTLVVGSIVFWRRR